MTATAARFHHADAGTPESTWLGSDRWDGVPTLDVRAVVRRYPQVLVVAAHPDDETLGIGGLLSDLADAGAGLCVLVVSDGERSHPLQDPSAVAALGARRRREVERAVEGLAPAARVSHLGLPDRGLAGHEEVLAEHVARRTDPDTLVLAPWLDDGHGDHDVVGRACAEAVTRSGADLAHYPVWLWHWGTPDTFPWTQVVASESSLTSSWRKRAALEEFSSQTLPWGGTQAAGPPTAPVLGPGVLDRARRLVETLIDPGGVLPLVPAASVASRAASRGERLDRMYDGGPDPWGFETSFYEERRRALVLAVLGCRRYRRVLEVGCADGRLTEALLGRGDEVVALDTSRQAVDATRRRVPGATVVHGVAPGDLPAGPFDLVVLSEVGYFLTPLELVATLRRAEAALAPGGEVLLCHWQRPTTDVPLDGVLVHEQAATVLSGTRRAEYVDEDVRIEVWGDPLSLAEQEGRA